MKNKKFIITVCIAVVLVIATIVAVVLVNGDTKQPVVVPPVTDATESEDILPIVEPPVVDPDETDNTGSQTDETKPSTPSQADEDIIPDLDVGQMTRNPEPGVVGGEVEYDTKN